MGCFLRGGRIKDRLARWIAGHPKPGQAGRVDERERSRIRDRFGVVLALLMVTVFFSISAPNEPRAWLATTATLAASFTIAMLASGAEEGGAGGNCSRRVRPRDEHRRPHVGGTGCKEIPLGYGPALDAVRYGTITRWVRVHAEINMLTVIAAVCIYVLLGRSFAFVFECVGEFGLGPSSPRTRPERAATAPISASSRWPRWATATSRPQGASDGPLR